MRKDGQAYLETLLVLLVLMLFLFGFLQVALTFGNREILHHASARAARSKAVGFNDWMAEKAARVASIPVSGKLLSAELGWEEERDGALADFEVSRIPSYLCAANRARADYELNYEEWEADRLHFSPQGSLFGNSTLRYRVSHEAPLHMPLAPLLFPWVPKDENDVPRVDLSAETSAAEHSRLYLSR